MLPKRKASEENPLTLAAKRARKEGHSRGKQISTGLILEAAMLPERKASDENPLTLAAKRARKEGHRRKSSLHLRGKRISTSFESTGVISQPHNSVSDTSFYKHIDPELPEPSRTRQLLIWCSYRAMNYTSEPTPEASSSKHKSKDSGKDPPLSAEGAQLLKAVQEDVIRMLAEGKIETGRYNRGAPDGLEEKPLKENAQNARNRRCMTTYSAQIQRAEAEDSAWEKADHLYDLRLAELAKLGSSTMPATSEKARGKQRAMSVDDDKPSYQEHIRDELRKQRATSEHPDGHAKGDHCANSDRLDAEPRIQELPAQFTEVELARSLLAEDLKGPLSSQMDDLQFKVDSIHSFASSALHTTNICESDLDHRFALLSFSLASRSRPVPPSFHTTTSALSNYLPANLTRPQHTTDPQELLRALSRVDAERPPAQVGDAARSAVRQIQRANQGGVAISDRRLTGVPPPTPRKAPGTPRRATTPGRER